MTQEYIIIISVIVGYLIGSIPFGLIFGFLFESIDVRREGSGNIGATNVLRAVGKRAAILTVACDMGKAMLVASFFKHYGLLPSICSGVFSILGHNFSIFLLGRGGKGVAATIAVFFIWNVWLGVTALTVWIATILLFGYSSLASLCMFFYAPFFSFIACDNMQIKGTVLFLSLLGFIRHHSNITRLLRGQEKKVILKR